MLLPVLLFALIASPCNPKVPKFTLVCETPGQQKILFGETLGKPGCFTRTHLIHYFSQFLAYPDSHELEVRLVSDRKQLTRTKKKRNNELVPLFEEDDWYLPKEDVIQSRGPFAIFRKLGHSTFFEFRDMKGAVETVILRGENVWLPQIEGFPVIVVGQAFFNKEEGTRCDKSISRTLIVVAPRFNEMTFDQLVSVCRYYKEVLGPSPLQLRIFASAQEARSRASFAFPSVAALEANYLGPPAPVTRLVWFSWVQGRGTAVLLKATSQSERGDVLLEGRRVE